MPITLSPKLTRCDLSNIATGQLLRTGLISQSKLNSLNDDYKSSFHPFRWVRLPIMPASELNAIHEVCSVCNTLKTKISLDRG